MNPNTGGPASEKTLLDEFAGQALAGMAASSFWAENVQANRPDYMKPVALSAYAMAEAMLAERARREAVVRPATSLDVVAHERSQALDRVIELEAANRELVEALRSCDAAFSKFAPQEESAYGMAWVNVRAAITKAKEVA